MLPFILINKTKIETSDKRMEEIVNHSSAPLNHNEQEIAGYRDALNAIHNGFANIPLDEQRKIRNHLCIFETVWR